MSLTQSLLRRIAADGPISLADYMQEALLHPDWGYYTSRDPLGAAGDFITAPEISQMFGELVGLALVQAWQDQGAPQKVTLAELGPGRGTLMRDALRAAAQVPDFAPEVVLIEASPTLRHEQERALRGQNVTWADHVEALPETFLLLIANEFFDALPIRQFQRSGTGWREIRIGAENGKLARGLGQLQPQPALAHRLEDTKDGDIVELCPALPTVTQTISDRIARHGGAALIIDYGDWRSQGDTFQALRGHTPVDPLDAPGTADLTAHVDFEAITQACRGIKHTKITPQGLFLERLGITTRAQALARKLSGADLDTLVAAHRRLTHPDEMGNLFKVLGLFPDSAPPLPGLEP